MYIKILDPHEGKHVMFVFLSLARFAKMMMSCPLHSICDQIKLLCIYLIFYIYSTDGYLS